MEFDTRITGPLYFVENLDKTREFYEGLGFSASLAEADYLEMHLGDETAVHMEFVPIAKELPYNALFDADRSQPRGNGVFLYIRLAADIDAFYETLVAKGYKPSGEPKNWPWKKREFVLRDPDGYKLIYWQKLD